MDPIAFIARQLLMHDSLTGAVANDPVLPEPTRRLRRRRNRPVTSRGIDTTRRIASAIARAFGENERRVHIHMGPDERPYVCEAARCTSPGMSARDF